MQEVNVRIVSKTGNSLDVSLRVIVDPKPQALCQGEYLGILTLSRGDCEYLRSFVS